MIAARVAMVPLAGVMRQRVRIATLVIASMGLIRVPSS